MSEKRMTSAPEPEGQQLDSDEVWLAMLKRENQKVTREDSFWACSRRVDKRDPLCLEIEEAKRSFLLNGLRTSYASRGGTLLWAMVVFLIGVVVLVPIIGFVKGPCFAAFVAASWAVLHRVRRI